ncbi:MAG: CinA family protein [Alphaproteobacteria bacterium]|nr:CinA family protein [Alphaproteobacteria bacterium]
MIDAALLAQASALLDRCRAHGLRLVTVESCTGGLIAACLTAIPGSSAVVERGFVTYSNEAKIELVGVDPDLLRREGAVSEAVVCAMATGALAASPADLSIAVTGIAGPASDDTAKPVGLVHIAAARRRGAVVHIRHIFPGDRTAIRLASVATAFRLASTLAL